MMVKDFLIFLIKLKIFLRIKNQKYKLLSNKKLQKKILNNNYNQLKKIFLAYLEI